MKNKIKLKQCIAFVLVMFLALGTPLLYPRTFISAEESAENGNTVISDDKSVSFSIDENGHFQLKNNLSGKIWYSIPQDTENDKISAGLTATDIQSELIIEYLFRVDENTQFPTQKSNSYIMCESESKITVSKTDDGFRVLYRFEEIDIEIPVEYKLKGNALEASVDIKGIDEGKECYLVSLEFLPYFGAAGADENGYLFIPDGCGAIAEFNKNIKPLKSYEKRVYGTDPAHSDEALTSKETNIILPVFGTVQNNDALMAVITSGDGAAEILAETGNDNVYYNSINSKMLYRIYAEETALYKAQGSDNIYTITHTDFGAEKYTVNYYVLSGENASYSGMAREYKEYLKDTYSLKEKGIQPKLAIKAYGCLEEQKNFIGFDYYKKRALTTYAQLEEILNDLTESNVGKIAVQYIGWSGNGVVNRKLPTGAKALSILGGKKELKSLNAFAEKKNIELFFDTDLLNFKTGGNGISPRKNGSKAPNGDTAKIYEYSKVTYAKEKSVSPNYLLSIKYLDKYLNVFLKNFKKISTNSISLSTMGNTVYSDFKANTGTYRTKNISSIQKALETVRKQYKSVALTGGNAYAIPYADMVYEAPTSSSGYDMFEYDVPFYQMVVSDFVTYTTSPIIQSVDYNDMFLKAAETGSNLLFDCIYTDSSVLRETSLSASYSSQYKIWKDKAVKSYNDIKQLYSAIEGSCIKSHERLSDGVYRTEYKNGVNVYVNYNDYSFTGNGITVPEGSLKVTEAAK